MDRSGADPQVVIGQTILHYEVVQKLGEGGMGVVFKARDHHLNRYVALKILPAKFVADSDCKTRFIQEARSASALNHPGIITIHDIAHEQDMDFIVMEYVDGVNLHQVLSERPLPFEKAVRYATQLAQALIAAHNAGIVHRDLKPANIMLSADGRIKVLDFGLAKLTDTVDTAFHAAATASTGMNTIAGTPQYMSPEQAEGRKLDRRSDIFSFGLVLYEMLSGRRAFNKESAISTIAAILHTNPEPLRAIVSDMPHRLDDIVQRCLQKNPADRFQQMGEVRQALEDCQSGTKPAAAEDVVQAIAVLPFNNLSSDKDNEYFSDGLTEEITIALAKVSGLRVTARTSAFLLRGKIDDIREIGEKLKVGAILEGSVRRAGNRVRITAKLVNVTDGYQMWSERFDRTMEDIFEIQDEITASIVDSLRKTLAGANGTPIGNVPASRPRRTVNLNAHEAYLQGRFHWNRRTFDSLSRGIEYFNEAIDIDPQLARAYVGLADSYNLLGYYNERSPVDSYPRAKAAAMRALELDDTLAEAHASLGYTTLFYDWDWKAADAEFRRAIDISPNYASAHQWHAWYYFAVNRLDDAVAAMQQAHQMDPLSPIITSHLALSLSYVGRHQEAAGLVQGMLEVNSDFPLGYVVLGGIQWRAGHQETALEHFRKAIDSSGGRFGLGYFGHACAVMKDLEQATGSLGRLQDRFTGGTCSPLEMALIHAGMDNADQAFTWLQRAVEERTSDLIRVRLQPWPPSIRSDPRFDILVRGIGLP